MLVPKVYEVSVDPQRDARIVMERYDGTLDDLGSLWPELFDDALKQASLLSDRMHAAGYIHRDLGIQNIFYKLVPPHDEQQNQTSLLSPTLLPPPISRQTLSLLISSPHPCSSITSTSSSFSASPDLPHDVSSSSSISLMPTTSTFTHSSLPDDEGLRERKEVEAKKDYYNTTTSILHQSLTTYQTTYQIISRH